jgi:hypothetical protein
MRLIRTFRNKFIIYGEGLLAPRSTPKPQDHPCRLSAAAYSIYSQLTSIAGGRFSIRNPRPRHAVGAGTPPSVCFDVTDQLLIRFFAFVRCWRKKWEYNETVHQLFINFKKDYDSVRRQALYNILLQLGVPMKLVRLIKMCLN